MGASFLLTAVVVAASAATVLFAKGPKSSAGSDMAPANLDAFRLTTAEEGTVIPRVFGTARLTGNLLYYGGLTTVPEYEETSTGGKGGGSKTQSTLQGYHYYLDVWQGIGMGPLELVRVYREDRQTAALSCAEQQWNNGKAMFYPTQAGQYASRLPGVAHVWLRQFYLGMNAIALPTLHFVVKYTGSSPVVQAFLPNGMNPAAIIWQLLLDAGAKETNIDTASFQSAATFWAGRGYGLNMVFSKQLPVREHIAQVLRYVDGWFIERADGTMSLRAPDPETAPAYTLHESDFLEGSFTFRRASWDTTWNDFSGKFTDAEQDYTERAVATNNAASIQLLGMRRKKSVDLSAFTDRTAAQRRLEEIRDVESYPAASFSFDLPREYAGLEQGQTLSLSHTRFGLSGVRVRVLEVTRGGLGENRISVQARQVVEHQGGFFAAVAGVPRWAAPDLTPVPLTRTRILELPRNPLTGKEPALLVLAARENLTEEGLLVERATAAGADYVTERLLSAPWAQCGTLTEGCFADTALLDEAEGLTFQPYREDPIFGPVSRVGVVEARRMALVDDEIMLFQTVTLVGTANIRLSGLVRGYMNTTVADHAIGARIWLFQAPRAGCNLIPGGNVGTHFLKLRPVSGDTVLGADAVNGLQVRVEGRARQPWAVTGLRAERTGSSVRLTWFPVDVDHGGAGIRTENENEPVPMAFSGDFAVSIASGDWQSVA
ncbi:MAG: phage tail protein, partial [Bilophila sp.]